MNAQDSIRSRRPTASLRATAMVLAVVWVLLPLRPAASQGVSATATAASAASRAVQTDPQERTQIIREIDALRDSIEVASKTIRRGQSDLERLSIEIRRLEDDVAGLKGSSEDVELQTRILDLRRRMMESRMRGTRIRIPDLGELNLDTFMPPDSEFREMGGTSTRRDIFRFGRDVEVGVFEKVRGDVICIGGRVTVRGAVTGNVVSVGNDVHIMPTGRVDGDAVTIGGRIIQEAGGTIRGDFVDTSFWPSHWPWVGNRVAWLAISLAGVAFILIASLIVGLIVPANVRLVEKQVRSRFGISLLIGLICEILLPVLIVLLLVTIVGIPVALILVPVALFGLFLLGFTGVAQAVGRGVSERGLSIGSSPLALITLGVIVLQLLYLLGRALRFTGWILGPVGFAAQLLGFLVLYVAWTSGMGAALLTRFGTRPAGQVQPPKPAPPPVGAESPA